MLTNIDYMRVCNLIDTISRIPDSYVLEKILSQSFASIDSKRKVENNALHTWICSQKELKNFLSEPTDQHTDLDIYLYLYTHVVHYQKVKDLKSLTEIEGFLPTTTLKFPNRSAVSFFEFILASYLIRTRVISWKELSDSSEAKDWISISKLSILLPLSHLPIAEFTLWITETVKKNEKDMALPSLGKSVKEWATLTTEDTKNFEDQIPIILANRYAQQFLPAIIQGLRIRQERDIHYYLESFAQNASANSMFNILHSIGSTLSPANSERNEYFKYINEKREIGLLNSQEFIRLCSVFGYCSKDVLDFITSQLILENLDIYLAVADLLFYNYEKVNLEWYENTMKVIMTVGSEDLIQWQQSLLSVIIERDIAFAYTLLNQRIAILGEKYLLEENFRDAAEKRPSLFRTYFVSWVNSDNPLVHRAILHISALSIREQLFNIPENAFQNYSKSELIYMGAKMVGYIYSQKPLQHSLLSLIKSIKVKDEDLFQNFAFILSEYLVYNYRSTLKLLKEELKSKSINQFAKSLFQSTIKEYDKYFKNLDQVNGLKEIKPNTKLVQMRRFYEQKQFGSLPKEENSFLNFAKETQINAHRWAIRRPGVSKHEISNMGKISYEMEFPSGEILSPVHHESIRREMQLLRKDEINID